MLQTYIYLWFLYVGLKKFTRDADVVAETSSKRVTNWISALNTALRDSARTLLTDFARYRSTLCGTVLPTVDITCVSTLRCRDLDETDGTGVTKAWMFERYFNVLRVHSDYPIDMSLSCLYVYVQVSWILPQGIYRIVCWRNYLRVFAFSFRQVWPTIVQVLKYYRRAWYMRCWYVPYYVVHVYINQRLWGEVHYLCMFAYECVREMSDRPIRPCAIRLITLALGREGCNVCHVNYTFSFEWVRS